MNPSEFQGFPDDLNPDGLTPDPQPVDNPAEITDPTGFDPSELPDVPMDVPSEITFGASVHGHHDPSSQIAFGSAGRCWWCHGTGVVSGWGQNQKCSHCGGSGIGPR